MRSPSSRKRSIRTLRTVTTATTVRAAGPPADRRNDARSYRAGAADHQGVGHLLIAHRSGSLFQGRWSLPMVHKHGGSSATPVSASLYRERTIIAIENRDRPL